MKKILVKNKEQIYGIRKACKLAANTLKFAGENIKEGITANYLNDIIHNFILKYKGKPATLGYLNFPKSCCISINEQVCHGIPNDTVFKNGDIVKVDVATIFNGYFGDNCATFPVGEISIQAENLIKITKECLDLGIKQVKPNNYLNNIGNTIYNHATKNNYGVVFQYAGHGVGCEFHEAPNVSHTKSKDLGPKMQTGWIFTIEPMINIGNPVTFVNESDGWTVSTIDKSLSAQFEHTVLVTNDGYEILTIPSSN